MIIRYITQTLLAVPLLPILYFKGKQIRKSIPKLPEAIGTEGMAGKEHKAEIRLLCLGESTMAGVGVKTHQEGFVGTLAKELSTLVAKKVKWKVMAKSGYTAKDINQKLVSKITENYDIIVIGLGGNDSFQLNSPMQWQKDVQVLIDSVRIKHSDIPIAFTNMPPIKLFPAFTWPINYVLGGRGELLGEALEQVVAKNSNVYFSSEIIDLEVWTKRYSVKNETSAFFSDGVHPSLLTYQVWAKDFANFLISKVNDRFNATGKDLKD